MLKFSTRWDSPLSSRKERASDFQFDENVSAQFEDMLQRSVPFYSEITRMSVELAREYNPSGKVIYDLGCSTGETGLQIAQTFLPEEFEYIGIDNSASMIEKALRKTQGKSNLTFKQGDITEFDFNNAGTFISNFTLQFLRPLQRQPLLEKICKALPEEGAFILGEKVLEDHSDISRLFVDLYYDFKKREGYSELEIARKRESLENVLIPYRLDENIEMLRNAGFSKVNIAFKWYNFVLFLAVK